MVFALGVAFAMNNCVDQEPPQAMEETIIGAQFEPYTRSKNFSEDYEQALDQKREDLDEQIDGD